MKSNILPAVKLTLVCLIFFSGVYTLAVWGVAQVASPNNGKGEIINYVSDKGDIKYGYANIAQKFTQAKYFWSRPSAVAYNAAGSAPSNFGPSNPDYLKMVKGRIDTFLLLNPAVKREDVPVELVTASGSGLDPDLSPKAALVQVARIAKARNMPEDKLIALVNEHTQKPLLGLFGPPKVNVLKLNVALDGISKTIN
jgi:K+-transporting ATPase ATPase C chain